MAERSGLDSNFAPRGIVGFGRRKDPATLAMSTARELALPNEREPGHSPFVLSSSLTGLIELSLQEIAEITTSDEEALRNAVKSLERPSLAGRLTNLVVGDEPRAGASGFGLAAAPS